MYTCHYWLPTSRKIEKMFSRLTTKHGCFKIDISAKNLPTNAIAFGNKAGKLSILTNENVVLVYFIKFLHYYNYNSSV
jgi:hypothetical protein